MKRITALLLIIITVFSLVACGDTVPGPKGDTGERGEAATVEISEDGYWIINGEKTEYQAIGKDGEDGKTPTVDISDNGYWIINGTETAHKAIGEDGRVPTVEISHDGYWVINGKKTEHKAAADGDDTGLTPDDGSTTVDRESTASPDDLTFIQNGNLSADYSDLKPEFRALLSTVRVVANFERYLGYGQTTLTKSKKESSGIIYKLDRESGDAYIITNFHAVYLKDAVSAKHISDNIEVMLYGQESSQYSVKATYIGGSLQSEIAVLKISGSEVIKNSHALALTAANSNDVRVFDEVFAIGNPKGFGLSATDGIISTENEALSLIGADGATSIKLRVFRTSAAINEGNSGGGLYDKDGRLVGVVVAKKTGEEIDNMAYAIPSNLAIAIADILIEGYTGAVTVGYAKYDLGITVSAMASGIIVDPASGALIKEERVRISSVAAGSALESLVKVDDIITSVTVDGKTTAITATHLLSDAMLKARLGSTVTVTVLRDGKSLSHTVEITDGMKITVG